MMSKRDNVHREFSMINYYSSSYYYDKYTFIPELFVTSYGFSIHILLHCFFFFIREMSFSSRLKVRKNTARIKNPMNTF